MKAPQIEPILTDPSIRQFYLRITREEQLLFDELAGILQYDENLPRWKAEHKAFMELLKLRRAKYNFME